MTLQTQIIHAAWMDFTDGRLECPHCGHSERDHDTGVQPNLIDNDADNRGLAQALCLKCDPDSTIECLPPDDAEGEQIEFAVASVGRSVHTLQSMMMSTTGQGALI